MRYVSSKPRNAKIELYEKTYILSVRSKTYTRKQKGSIVASQNVLLYTNERRLFFLHDYDV